MTKLDYEIWFYSMGCVELLFELELAIIKGGL